MVFVKCKVIRTMRECRQIFFYIVLGVANKTLSNLEIVVFCNELVTDHVGKCEGGNDIASCNTQGGF